MAARLTLRIDLGPDQAIGPGKIRLLEAIERTGSISKAGRALGMSYRRAWLLVDDLNKCFRQPVVSAQTGGTRGGGAVLTAFGATLIKHYRAIERYRGLGVWNRDPVLHQEGFDRLKGALVSGGLIARGDPFARCVDNRFAEQALAADPPAL